MPTPASIDEADFIKDPPPGYLCPPLLWILRAYCVGLLKTCGYVIQRVKTESYYEVSPLSVPQLLLVHHSLTSDRVGGGFRQQHLPSHASRRR